MPLTPAEQKELDELELAELEAQEAPSQPSSIESMAQKYVDSAPKGGFLRQAADTATAVAGGIGTLGGLYNPRYPGMQQAMKEHPIAAELGGYAGQAAATPAVGKLASFLGRGAQAATGALKNTPPEAIKDAVKVASPRLGHLLDLLGKLGSKPAAAEAESAASQAVKAVPNPLNKNWDFPTR
jgi:hypothetical protein